MRSPKIILCIVSVLGVCAQAQREASPTRQQTKRTVIAASTVLDGRGHVLHDTDANMNLRGTIEGQRFHGKWSFDGYARAISKGTFEATGK